MRRAEPEIEAIATQLKGLGISSPYASQLARGVRQPSRAMAVRIFQGCGLRLGCLENASDAEIDVLAKFEEAAA